MKKKTINYILDLVREGYNKIAIDFDISRDKVIWSEINNIVSEVKREDKILDIGCGNGRLIKALPEGIEYLGVDNSEELIKIDKNKYNSNNFIVDNILGLDKVKNNHYDYIFCLAVLQHVPSNRLRIKAINTMKTKLKNGGSMVISNWNLWQTKHKKRIIKTIIGRIIGLNNLDFGDIIFPWKNSKGKEISLRYYHSFTIKELKRISKKAGMRVKKVYKDRYNYWLILEK